jgi:acetylornithine deacetylase/succinyl-diaminopimelate desuccinylase-like protein
MNAVELLQALLRVDTTNPPGNERPAAELLATFLSTHGAETESLVSPAGRVNLVARWPGPPDKSALVLLSHTDVVAVEEQRWTRPPFGGDIAEGFIWGRGALDMKGIAAMHAVAGARAAEAGVERELIIVAVADEEAGSREGARWLLEHSPEKVGFSPGRPMPEVLGEGAFGLTGRLDRPVMLVALGEKQALWLDLVAEGEPGHGSLPPAQQAPASLAAAITKISGHRNPRVHPVMARQFQHLAGAATGPRALTLRALGSATGTVLAKTLRKRLDRMGPVGHLLADTVTPTAMAAGYKHNVVPGEARASLDCRLLPDTDPDDFIAAIEKEAGRYGVRVEEVSRHRGPVTEPTSLYDRLISISSEIDNAIAVPSLTTGFSDLRLFRDRGAAGYGWCPVVLTPELLTTVHGHDERIPEAGFIAGVEAMSEVVIGAVGKA